MEVVLLLVALTGIALIAVPRLRARRAGAASRRRPPRAGPVPRAAAEGTWAPAAPSESEEDVSDDDLGWEGQDATPATRDEWNKWRDAQAPEPESPKLPSVDRWRERAGDDWLEDDDGLGWEGEGLKPPSRNGRPEPAGSPPSAGDIAAARHADAAAAREGDSSRNGVFAARNGHAPDLAPAPTGLASPGDGLAERGVTAPGDGLVERGPAPPGNGAVTRTFTRPDGRATGDEPAESNGGAAHEEPAAPPAAGTRRLDWLTPCAPADR